MQTHRSSQGQKQSTWLIYVTERREKCASTIDPATGLTIAEKTAYDNWNKSQVADYVPLTERQIAAKQKTEGFTKDNSSLGNAAHMAVETANGYFGAGYNMGHIEKSLLAEKGAISDYAHFTAGLKRGIEKTATTAGVVLTAVNAPIVLPAAFVGTVATRMVLNNEGASAAIKGTITTVTDYARSLLPTADAAINAKLMENLSRTPDGGLTPQGDRVLQLINERAQQQTGIAPNIDL